MKKRLCIMLICVFAVTTLTGCGDPIDSFTNEVMDGNYDKAVEIFRSEIMGNSTAENTAITFLQNFIDESWSKYIAGTIADEAFLDQLTTVQKIDEILNVVSGLGNLESQYPLVKASKDSYSIGVTYMDEGNYENAIDAFSQVIPEDTANYDNAQQNITEATNAYEEGIIASARQFAASGDFDEAVFCITEAQNVIGSTQNLEKCLEELYTQEYRENISEAYTRNDYVTVINEYCTARNNAYVVVDSEMTRMYSSSVTEYIASAKNQAEEEFGDDKNYTDAITFLQSSLIEVSEDSAVVEAIEDAIAEYQEYIPVSLTSLEYTQKGRYIKVGGVYGDNSKDVNNIQYERDNIICASGGSLNSQYASSDDEASVLYYLNLNYSTLSGLIYRPYSSLSCDFEWTPATVKIYGDDILLYESPSITQETYDTIEFTVDVTGVRNLKIVMRGVWGEATPGWVGLYDYYPKACLTNLMLQK